MRAAGLEEADHFVGAACSVAFIPTTAVFGTETLASRGGGAARHGARLPSTAMDVAIATFILCVGGASIKLAISVRTMLAAEITCFCNSIAAVNLAHLLAATAVQAAPAS